MSDWTQWPDIVEVLNYYGVDFVPLRQGWAPVKCPFHEDRIKSACASRSHNAFTCHACAISGVAIHVVMERENLGYAEARHWSEETFGASDGVLSTAHSIRIAARAPASIGEAMHSPAMPAPSAEWPYT